MGWEGKVWVREEEGKWLRLGKKEKEKRKRVKWGAKRGWGRAKREGWNFLNRREE